MCRNTAAPGWTRPLLMAWLLAAACADEARTGGGAGTGGAPGDAGAARSDSPVEENAGEVELKVAWWGGSERALRTRMVLGLFEAKNPKIKIVEESYAAITGDGGYWPVMEAHAAANTLPDVMQHDFSVLQEWTEKGRLRALDDMTAAGAIRLGDVPAALVEGGKVNGHVMGITLGLNTQMVVIDADRFKAAGLGLPADDWSWEDFETAAVTIKRKLGIWGAGANLWNTTAWRSLFLSKRAAIFTANGTSLAYTDDKPWNDHLHMIVRLLNEAAIPTMAQEGTTNVISQLALVQGKAAMDILPSSNQMVLLWETLGEARNLKALPLPRIKGALSAVYMKPSQYFSVTTQSKHPKEAARLIDFFLNDIEANLILMGERGVPTPDKVREAMKPKLGHMELEAFLLTERMMGVAAQLPPLDPPAFLNTIFNGIYVPKVIRPVMNGVWTPEMATAVFRTEANEVLMGKPVRDGGPPAPERPLDGGAADRPDAGPLDATIF